MSSATATTAPTSGVRTSSKGPEFLAFVFAAGGIGLTFIAFLWGWFSGNDRPIMSWLFGMSFWLSITIGMLMLIQLLYVFDSGWSAVIRRHLEHCVGVFKWYAILFVPLALVSLIGSETGLIWKWMDPNYELPGGITVSEDVLYTHKAGYLNQPFFFLRTILYFAVFIGLANLFRKISFRNDIDPDPKNYSLGRKWSAAGIVLTALSLTFLSIDWFKSIEYHWFSTMYGVWFFAASMWSSLGVTALGMFLLSRKGGVLEGLIGKSQFYLVGCLMLAFTVFWTYISFSQFFLQYSANIPEETFWYNLRQLNPDGSYNSWWPLNYMMIFGHFLAPFLVLLFYNTKVRTPVIALVGLYFLSMHAVDMYFNILPEKKVSDEYVIGYATRPFGISIWDVTMLIGVGGLFVWSYLKSAATTRPIPVNDPRIKESLTYHV